MHGSSFVDRRDFLKRSALIAMAPSLPAFLPRTLRATPTVDNGRILVVLQLSGGNDGINTVIPFADEGYKQNRNRLRIPVDQVLKINDGVGLHPNLRGVHDMLEAGRAAFVQGVGYPNPNRSHDVSMAIWQTARLDPEDHQSAGWIGTAIDEQLSRQDGAVSGGRDWSATHRGPHMMLMGDENPPLAIRSRKSTSVALAHLEDLRLHTLPETSPTQTPTTNVQDDLLSFVRRSQVDAFVTAELLERVTGSEGGSSSVSYPNSELATRLKMIAQLIKAEFSTPVYYAIQPGYDTHAAQLPAHARLMNELSRALAAFDEDLQAAGLGDRVMVMCFSEFGRRVKENASLGTDHGTSGPVLLCGSAVQAGLIGETPSMSDILDGDLKTHIDFRNLYASVLANWLELPTESALKDEFEPLDILS